MNRKIEYLVDWAARFCGAVYDDEEDEDEESEPEGALATMSTDGGGSHHVGKQNRRGSSRRRHVEDDGDGMHRPPEIIHTGVLQVEPLTEDMIVQEGLKLGMSEDQLEAPIATRNETARVLFLQAALWSMREFQAYLPLEKLRMDPFVELASAYACVRDCERIEEYTSKLPRRAEALLPTLLCFGHTTQPLHLPPRCASWFFAFIVEATTTSHTTYRIRVEYMSRQWNVLKRYTEFAELDAEIRRRDRAVDRDLVALPEPLMFHDDDTPYERWRGLNHYMRELLRLLRERQTYHQLLLDFFGLRAAELSQVHREDISVWHEEIDRWEQDTKFDSYFAAPATWMSNFRMWLSQERSTYPTPIACYSLADPESVPMPSAQRNALTPGPSTAAVDARATTRKPVLRVDAREGTDYELVSPPMWLLISTVFGLPRNDAVVIEIHGSGVHGELTGSGPTGERLKYVSALVLSPDKSAGSVSRTYADEKMREQQEAPILSDGS